MTTHYERLGGEAKVRELAETFYRIMDTDPNAKTIRALHPFSLHESTEKFFYFLSGWTGGPPLYTDRFGHPRLRARHLPFPIGEKERDEWLYCMQKALNEVVADESLKFELLGSFARTADFMRNKEG
ncbi:MAG: group II truncated hemoglobin [Chloroherpetonaceae bacterium]|nr:group II truncated hemoglobin [Chloroherpetonaceae bacterium]